MIDKNSQSVPCFLWLGIFGALIGSMKCLDIDKDNSTALAVANFSQDNADFWDDDNFADSSEQLPCADLRGYAFHNETKKCWPVGVKGPCKNLMIFLTDQNHEGYGDCDCSPMANCIGRPRTYWPDTDRCYFIYSRGPCRPGQFLVFNKTRKPECSPRMPECGKMAKSKKSMEFQFPHNGKCYTTGTQAFCDEGETVYISSSDLKPKCFNVKPVCRFLIFTAKTLTCRPGSKLDVTGQCDHMRELDDEN